MWRFIVITFAFLAIAFWELSGGADYAPQEGSLQAVARAEADARMAEAPVPQAQPRDTVSRADTNALEITLASARQTDTRDEGARDAPSYLSPADKLFSEPVAPEPRQASLEVAPAPDRSAAQDADADLREVSGDRVNMRGGPGTGYGVLDTLTRGEVVEVLEETGTGWVRLRARDSGQVGWMADFLLADLD